MVYLRLGCLAALLLACGTPTKSLASTPPSTPSPGDPSPSVISTQPPPDTISVAGSRYGRIIVDGQGRTLYLFDAEHSPTPRCYGACASAWPPLLTATSPVAGGGLSQALMATVTRTDGSMQVTYNGHALYLYIGDRTPGEIKCQAIVEYGGGWFVVDTQGNKITTP